MRELTSSDVLVRVAANPRSEFAVRSVAPEHLDLLRPFASFRPEPERGDCVPCPTRSGDGCMRVIDVIAGEHLAICPCAANEAPLPIDPLDLVTFTIAPDRVAKALAGALGASGPTAALSDRCWYLGTASLDKHRFGLTLGLFDDRDAMSELRALPGAIPDAVDEVVCLTPTFQPSPHTTLALAAIHVRVARLRSFDVHASLQKLLSPAARTVPFVALSPAQEQQAVAARFLCSWPIVVTGRIAARGLNVVEINGAERRLSPKAFTLFMRLVTGLFEGMNGYLPKGRLRDGGGLAAEGYYTSDGMDQAIWRLRNALGPEFKSLVEGSGGMIRLSTHPRYIAVNCELLAQHPNDAVQSLSARILLASGSDGGSK